MPYDHPLSLLQRSCAWCYTELQDNAPLPKVTAELDASAIVPANGVAVFRLGDNMSPGYVFGFGMNPGWAGTIIFLTCSDACHGRLRAAVGGRALMPMSEAELPADALDADMDEEAEMERLETCAWCGSRLLDDVPTVEVYAKSRGPVSARTLEIYQFPEREVHAFILPAGHPSHADDGWDVVFLNCSTGCARALEAALTVLNPPH